MPGKNLSNTEKRLQKRWDAPSTDSLDLTGIYIDSHEESTGLRGISQAEINFEYPVSVLVGKKWDREDNPSAPRGVELRPARRLWLFKLHVHRLLFCRTRRSAVDWN